MKKNRDKEESPCQPADHLLKKGPAENLLVFLALALFIVSLSFFSSHRLFFPKKNASVPQGTTEKYVWVTDFPGRQDGLRVLTPEQLRDIFPEITASELNSPVSAFQYDGDAPQPLNLPPAVANIFFQPIPINRADKDILASLPGIGPVLAEKIIKRRADHGPFRSKDELLHIAGIGPKKYEMLVDRITLD